MPFACVPMQELIELYNQYREAASKNVADELDTVRATTQRLQWFDFLSFRE